MRMPFSEDLASAQVRILRQTVQLPDPRTIPGLGTDAAVHAGGGALRVSGWLKPAGPAEESTRLQQGR